MLVSIIPHPAFSPFPFSQRPLLRSFSLAESALTMDYNQQQSTPYQTPSVLNNPNYRPYTDPNTEEIDLNKYPEPKDSTKKIRGTNELLETVLGGLEPELVVAKGFYFFFYAAFGSLFPLLGVYFKQLGLNGAQAGVLSGIRPLVEYFCAPFWVGWAERNNKLKTMLLISISCWILFTFPLGSIQPEPVSCIINYNQTHAEIKVPDAPQVTWTRRKRDNGDIIDYQDDADKIEKRNKRAIPRPPPGITPVKLNYAVNYDPAKNANWVSPSFSSQIYKKEDVTKVFFLLLLIVIIGEALSSPAIIIADSAVLGFLGDEAGKRYGHQRMFGSCGWAIAMFFIGIALDHSTFPNRKCKALPQEKNYTVCFAIFVVLMGLALLLAWRMKMVEVVPTIELDTNNGQFENVELDQSSTNVKTQSDGIPHTTVFAQQNKKIPEWFIVLKHFKSSPNCMAFLFIAWLMGVGIGLIFTFLFWHLQDFGGSPTLFGLASVINHVSEIFAYFFSSQFITQLGHVKVLCVGLLCNVLRFLYISVLKNPWWVLPFEFVQGITHAACWAACSSYLAHHTPPELRQPAQSVLQGLHHGLGRGFGAVVGGFFVSSIGTKSTFTAYGVVCLITLAGFWFLNFYRKDSGFITELPQEEDPHNIAGDAGDSAHLAPHGVPGGGMTRVHSASRLQQEGAQYNTNPFAAPPPQQQQQPQQTQQEDYYMR